MSDAPQRPDRPLTLTLKIEADTPEAMLEALREKIEDMDGGCAGSTWGGWSASGYFHIEKRDITPEQYHERMRAYLKATPVPGPPDPPKPVHHKPYA